MRSALVVFLLAGQGTAGEYDVYIGGMIEDISAESLLAHVDTLVAFGTRRSDQPGGREAQDHILRYFSGLGLGYIAVQISFIQRFGLFLGHPVFAISVVLMAFTSVVGVATKLMFGGLEPGTFENWLAAAPVVALGAPLGALVVSRISRRPTLLIVSVLCVLQFAWTVSHEWHSAPAWSLAAAFLGVALFLLVFQQMYVYGRRLARRGQG
jgi:hypothetical protein